MSDVLPWFAALAGRLDEHVIDSVMLRDSAETKQNGRNPQPGGDLSDQGRIAQSAGRGDPVRGAGQ